MNEIDVKAKRREAERIAQEQDERMRQQEKEAIAIQEMKQRNR